MITLPTRFTRTNGTLIDNFFCKLCKSVLESTAGILTKRFSDHQPYFMMLNMNQKTNSPPKFIKKYNTSDEAMLNVRHEIQSEEFYSKLGKSCTADIHLNYEMINDEILRAKNKHMPCKLVKFNKYKHKKSALPRALSWACTRLDMVSLEFARCNFFVGKLTKVCSCMMG